MLIIGWWSTRRFLIKNGTFSSHLKFLKSISCRWSTFMALEVRFSCLAQSTISINFSRGLPRALGLNPRFLIYNCHARNWVCDKKNLVWLSGIIMQENDTHGSFRNCLKFNLWLSVITRLSGSLWMKNRVLRSHRRIERLL